MKKWLRGFGIGLLLTGAIYTTINYFETPAIPETAEDYEKIIKQLEKQLNEANEQITFLEDALPTDEAPAVNIEDPDKETVDSPEDKVPPQEAVKTEPEPPTAVADAVQGTIYIYEGVSLYDVGKQAEDAGVIQNSRELELFLSKPEYAKSVQKGQFELRSDMSLEEMARILTGKKGQ